MKRIERCIKTFTAYAVALTMLLSLMVFPNDIYARDDANSMVSIKTFNGQYLCAEDGGGKALTADRDKIGEWETFEMIDLGKGYIALMGYNGKYVSVAKDGKSVHVSGDKIKPDNKLQLVRLGNNKIALKAHNKRYICAENGGGGKVVADREKIGNWETFELIETKDDQIAFNKLGNVALLAANEKYLCAEDGGGSEITADRDNIGSWETFEIIQIEKNTAVLRTSNGRYLYLQDDKSGYINAKATKISERTKFIFSNLGDNRAALKASNGKYVTLENKGQIAANSKEVDKWSTFKMVIVQDANYDKCNLSATPGDKSISFTWSKPNSTKNIIGYNLYRATAAGKQSSTPVTDFPIEGNSYTDKNVEGGITYYYVLKIVYKDKVIGNASNEVAVSLESKLNLNAKAEDSSIKLYWSKPSNIKDIIGYNLYRATAAERQSNTPITDFPIQGTTYTDKNIENNTVYYYTLKAVYKDKTVGAASNEVVVKARFNNKTIVLEVGSRYMVVDGQRKEIDPGKGTIVIMKNGRVFLPIKAVVESLGGEVVWNSGNQRVSIYLDNNKIDLWIGDKTAQVNGQNRVSDVAPYISESGRTMLPLRFIIENLGCKADWDGVTEKVTILAVDN